MSPYCTSQGRKGLYESSNSLTWVRRKVRMHLPQLGGSAALASSMKACLMTGLFYVIVRLLHENVH